MNLFLQNLDQALFDECMLTEIEGQISGLQRRALIRTLQADFERGTLALSLVPQLS
jgi:hypothetical protein